MTDRDDYDGDRMRREDRDKVPTSREDLLLLKASIDKKAAQLKLTLKDWRREAAAYGTYKRPEDIGNLEKEIALLGQRSQKLQTAIHLCKVERGHKFQDLFIQATREIVDKDTFLMIIERTRELETVKEPTP